MTTMKALVVAPNDSAVVSNISIPEPGPNEIRVEVHSVALNPVDALRLLNIDRVVGSDIAGTVDKVGSNVQPRTTVSKWGHWNIGDRVAGFLQGATTPTERPGGYAEYAILEADLAILIPREVSFEEAATAPLCALTAAQALYIRLGIPVPFPIPDDLALPPPPANGAGVVVYSASTSIGLFALHLIRRFNPSNLRIFATSSPKHHDYLKSLGVDAVFDYNDPDWPEKARKLSNGTLSRAFDAISEDDSVKMISDSFGGEGIIGVVRGPSWNRDGIKPGVTPVYLAVWSGLGKEIIYNGKVLPADPAWRKFTINFFQYLSTAAVADGMFPVETLPVRKMPGSLERIPLDGFKLLGKDKVNARSRDVETKEEWMKPISREKMVYNIR